MTDRKDRNARRVKRLASGARWLTNKNLSDEGQLIYKYRCRYKVDKYCAIADLCELHAFSPEREERYRRYLKNRQAYFQQAAKKKRREKELRAMLDPEQDEWSFYIAGYTSGGAPYGITWEQAYSYGCIDETEYDSHRLL